MMPGIKGKKAYEIALGIIRLNVLEVVWNIEGFTNE